MATLTNKIPWKPFSLKHRDYIKNALHNKMSVAEGAIRSGKTIDHCIIAAAYLEKCQDKIHLASGSTTGNAKLNIGDCNGFGLEYLFRGRCKWGKYKDNDALYLKTQTGMKVVIFTGGGKANSYKKILGNSYGLWIATEINEHFDSDDSRISFIKVAFGRQVAAVQPMVLWDLNPCNPNHPIYTDYIDLYKTQYVGGYQYQHFTIADNLSITKERKAEIISQYVPGSIWYRRDIEGERCIAEGLVYPMHEDAIEDPPEGSKPTEYCLSIDYGTMNAFAALLWEKHGNTWYATKEYYYSGREEKKQKTDEHYAQELDDFIYPIMHKQEERIKERLGYVEISFIKRIETIIDPSAASFIAALKQRKNGWYKVRPGMNDVSDGIRETASAMSTGLIKISPKCTNWKKEMGGYIWNDRAEDDLPVKDNDHLADATRYFVYTKNLVGRDRKQKKNGTYKPILGARG